MRRGSTSRPVRVLSHTMLAVCVSSRPAGRQGCRRRHGCRAPQAAAWTAGGSRGRAQRQPVWCVCVCVCVSARACVCVCVCCWRGRVVVVAGRSVQQGVAGGDHRARQGVSQDQREQQLGRSVLRQVPRLLAGMVGVPPNVALLCLPPMRPCCVAGVCHACTWHHATSGRGDCEALQLHRHSRQGELCAAASTRGVSAAATAAAAARVLGGCARATVACWAQQQPVRHVRGVQRT
jgi:hypothetical protein